MMSSAKATKKSAFSCEPCRRRKVKCGGEQPRCQRCASRHDECIYKLNPTLSYTQRLERRIKELEDQLADRNTSPPSIPLCSPQSISSTTNNDAKTTIKTEFDEPANIDAHLTNGHHNAQVKDKGTGPVFGPKAFYLPHENLRFSEESQLYSDADYNRRQRLVSNAWQQRALEDLSETPEPFQYLLKVSWCWIQPLFNFIYRPAFTRDMQAMGPYYSHTLLNAVLSHSIRWGTGDPHTRRLLDESYDGGRVFAAHARSMLFNELSNGVCTVTTVQTLLLLSAQECTVGNTTQAWTYSGLAFRLMDHLGICVDGQRRVGPDGQSELSDEDIEIRRRVFWSSYFWDKIISLYLGRSPSLHESPASPLQVMFDDSSENDIWVPVGISNESEWSYPPAQAHSTSCFLGVSRLALIFNQILIHMYHPTLPNVDDEVLQCFHSQAPAMRKFWDELPAHLKIDPLALPELAPPSHIVVLNCLYHTFKILLYRPMLTRQSKTDEEARVLHICLVECVTSAISCVAIFDLFCRTFGMSHIILSLAYSVYIASTVIFLQVQATPKDQLAIWRLKYCLRRLDEIRNFSPVIAIGLDLLTQELSKLGIPLSPEQSASLPSPVGSSANQMHQRTDIHFQGMVQSNSAWRADSKVDLYIQSGVPVGADFHHALPALKPLTIRIGELQEALEAAKRRGT